MYFALNLQGASKERNLKITPKSSLYKPQYTRWSDIWIWDTKLPNSLAVAGIIESTQQLPFLCTWGAVYGCLEIHLDFIKVVCFYIISLYNGLADQWGRGGGRRTRDHKVTDQCCQISASLYGRLYLWLCGYMVGIEGPSPQPDIFLHCRFWLIRPWPRPSGNPVADQWGDRGGRRERDH